MSDEEQGLGYTSGGGLAFKPLRHLVQLDAWADFQHCDDIMQPDDDGDVLMSGIVREPQLSETTVRILIALTADPADVVRVLRKQLAWFEKDHRRLTGRDVPPW